MEYLVPCRSGVCQECSEVWTKKRGGDNICLAYKCRKANYKYILTPPASQEEGL